MNFRVIHRLTPPTLPGDDGPVPSPFAVPLGNDYYHVEPRYPEPSRAGTLERGDTLIADGINADTWSTLPAKAPAHADAILRTSVIRAADGTPLKPARKGETVTLEAARSLDPDTVTRLTIARKDVLLGDVVDADMIAPNHWPQGA